MIYIKKKPSLFLAFFLLIISTFGQYPNEITISKNDYKEQLKGFWLGQCIANWTGLVTEMDKIGNIGQIKTGAFYTRNDWGEKDLPNIWGERKDSISSTINFVLKDTSQIWGADDDTDIEYMYQHLLLKHDTSFLTPTQIAEGWKTHIKRKEENFLWVSNQRAFDLITKGLLPPATSLPINNQFYDMIDAQLTTEIFGLFAPARPDLAWKMAKLPVRTTARKDAELISRFYITMHSIASAFPSDTSVKSILNKSAAYARRELPDSTTPAKMFDYVNSLYKSNFTWEQTRDSIYKRYQVDQKDGYKITSQNLHCNGCFAAGINFAASLISLFYGEGDLKETIKVGTLTGWDSDNPTATWGGLIGFLIGEKEIYSIFGNNLSSKFNIHRTRQNFPNNGMDSFDNMAENGIKIVDKLMTQFAKDELNKNSWVIPLGIN